MAKKAIEVGSDRTAPGIAFGDDSQYGKFLAFAFVIVPRLRLSYVEACITALKERFRFPAGELLHCRVLFNSHSRDRAGLGHLSDDDAREIVIRAVRIM